MTTSVVQHSLDRTALILYGSETGNAQDIAEELGRLCERLRFTTNVCELDAIDIRQLPRYSVVLIAISTTGQGELPVNSRKFWKVLRSVRLPPGCLKQVRFASFGLGDTSYPKFNWAHRKLYNRLLQLRAQPVHDRGESDEQHPEGIDGLFIPWSLSLRKSLLEQYPLPEAIEPLPESVLIEPKWILDFADSNHKASLQHNGSSHLKADHSLDIDTPPNGLIPIPNSLTATVNYNTRITPQSHFQDTRHIVLSLPDRHECPPGATITIYPKNFPSDVSAILVLLSCTSIADRPLKFLPSNPNATDLSNYPPPPLPPSVGRITLRSLLTNYLDIMAIPRRSFFGHLQYYTENDMYLERLREFTSPELVDELYDYTTRPRRSILEALADFPGLKIPWQKVFTIIPMMRGRQFSIASGGLLKNPESFRSIPSSLPNSSDIRSQDTSPSTYDIHETTASTRIDLLIAIVRYRTIIKRVRHGVATRYISTLRPGQQINVTLQPGALGIKKEDMHKPVVMVGPGTGIAPMRALSWERAAWKATGERQPTSTKDLLFFGCRNKNVDEYFSHEWSDLDVDMHCAYSRDQREKVYVQDLVRQQAPKVFSLLAERGGTAFVCGSSGRMPQAVRQALIDVFMKEGGMKLEDAEDFLKKLEREGRYLQETW